MAQAAVDANVVETIAQASATPPASPYPATSGSTSSPAAPVGVATPNNAPASEELTNKAVQVYFLVGMVPTEKNTRNPMCYSNTFSVTIPFNPRGWGNNGRLLEVIEPMFETFRAKCARLGTVSGTVSYGASDNIASGFPRSTPHAEDYTVMMP
jgi:hypothetical protein